MVDLFHDKLKPSQPSISLMMVSNSYSTLSDLDVYTRLHYVYFDKKGIEVTLFFTKSLNWSREDYHLCHLLF